MLVLMLMLSTSMQKSSRPFNSSREIAENNAFRDHAVSDQKYWMGLSDPVFIYNTCNVSGNNNATVDVQCELKVFYPVLKTLIRKGLLKPWFENYPFHYNWRANCCIYFEECVHGIGDDDIYYKTGSVAQSKRMNYGAAAASALDMAGVAFLNQSNS